jgi:hypothetical protein
MIRMPSLTAPLLLIEKVSEKFDDVLASGVGRLRIVGDCDATFDAGVVGGGKLARIAVDDHAQLLFLEAAFARSRRLHVSGMLMDIALRQSRLRVIDGSRSA